MDLNRSFVQFNAVRLRSRIKYRLFEKVNGFQEVCFSGTVKTMEIVESGAWGKGKAGVVAKVTECNLSYAQFAPRTSFIF